ncbi:MAG: thiolase family protein [Planctomycetes bacterium]|nr:thiolase family protein [Planctomycetota bacterium]
MNEAVIVAASRTPIGKFQGVLSGIPSPELGAIAIRAVLAQSCVAPSQVNEVIMGNVLAAGIGQAPARQAALRAGLPPSVAALTINKVCGSGLKAIMLAAQAIRAGDADVVIAGGLESMSRAPFLVDRNGPPLGDRTLVDSLLHEGLTCGICERSMGSIAESLAESAAISREDQDQFSLESHRRAVAATTGGLFTSEIAPITITQRSGDQIVNQDEGPRADAALERLARLAPAFSRNGSVTAGNASMISDGAAAVIVTSRRFQLEHGLPALARISASATAGLEPTDLFVAPVPAVRLALQRAGLTTDDIDLFEINEAFAVQVLACIRQLGLSLDRVNVNGGAIALGHPLGCSGARVAVTLLHAMRQRQARRGVAALCLGGGNAVAAVFEAVDD